MATFGDIPGGERPIDPGDLAEFRARDVDRPGIPPEALMLALDGGTGSDMPDEACAVGFGPGGGTALLLVPALLLLARRRRT